ncbi:branched-chain amino acid ABC transporter permease [Rhodovulum sp. DZ06]|uniref:branched-chain amino acid ABC transporter permease n=1 Tax=Rhodovulum sp. DZ06 TaxID=3425126 RepID=UPI003D33F59F
MYKQTHLRSGALILTLAGLMAYAAMGGYYANEIVIEIAILGIMVIALDIAAGFGGMVSLCHGAIMGVSAYVYAIMTAKFGWPNLPSALMGVAAAAVFGTLVGYVTGRTAGIFFIMATLAFGQMAHTLFFKSRWLGGDDGMGGFTRFDLSAVGIDMNDSVTFSAYALLLVLCVYIAAAYVLRSGFGRTLEGIHGNEDRMKALGVDTQLHKARAMGFSALLTGVAGVLAAQHVMYISPELLMWTVSGEVLIVVILGGLGTLVGPLIGAVAFVLLKHEVSAYTAHWHIVIGALLIVTVLAGGKGMFGTAERLLTRRPAPARTEEAADA